MRGKTENTSEENGHSNNVGACPDVSIDAMFSLGPQKHYEQMPVVRLFLAKYHQYPSILECETDADDIKYHMTTILDYLRDQFNHDMKKDCVEKRYHRSIKQKYVQCRFSDLANGVMIHFDDCSLESDLQNPNKLKADHGDDYYLTTSSIKIYYLPEHDAFAQDLFDHFSQMVVFSTQSCHLQMVCRNDCGYYLRRVKIKKPLITDLALHYGQTFVGIHDRILRNLNEKESKGIVLLHGIPGSGKTHYIRYLIQEVKDKTLIYIPPDMAKEIASPQFLPFLMEQENAVLIIEDAENIIKDRNESSTPSQAVANLLNLSDGLLGDAMHQQIVATFNCDLTTIDPALLRKGRLIANYEFNKLDLESSKILSDKLGYGTEQITEPMTLAEIYNQGDQRLD